MKKISTYLLALAGMAMLAFSSCKKDETRVVATPGTATTLSATSTSPALTKATAASAATTLSWNTSSFGYPAVVSYSLEFDRKGNNFAAPVSVAVAGGSNKAYTVGDLNAVAIQAGFAPDKAAQMETRLKAAINPTTASYSNVITFNITPYRDFVVYPSVYVPGDYQGWNPAAAPTLASVKNDKVYEGYVNFATGTNQFKITSDPDWNHSNYGILAGKLSTDGGAANLSIPSFGYYLVKADINALTFSATKISSFSLFGSATGNADRALTYDATTQTFKGTFTLAVGTFVFRANNASTIVLGDRTPVTTFLTNGGAAINVPTAGTYQVVLNVSVSGNYYYELNKQ